MSSDIELKFFDKANQTSQLHRRAIREGRKLGRWSDKGVFFDPETPPHILNQPVLLPTAREWQEKLEQDLVDPLIQKLGPGYTISAIYYRPELRSLLTSDEIERLWEQCFRHHPHEDRTPWAYPDVIAEANARRAKRSSTSN